MNGYEHPTRDTPAHAVYRLSWLAYANVIMTAIFFIAVSLGIASWTTHNARSDSAYQIGITHQVHPSPGLRNRGRGRKATRFSRPRMLEVPGHE